MFQRLGGRIFETSEIIPKVLPKSLLQLFVDIEFTGHSMEFEQKFGMSIINRTSIFNTFHMDFIVARFLSHLQLYDI